jgi:hypothetical protein
MSGRLVLRLAAASVWLHQGLWCKVLANDPHHREIVGSIPGVSPPAAGHLTRAVGLGETVLAGVVVARGDRRSVAALQLALVGTMNVGGLLVGRRHIARPGRLLARNALFAAVVCGGVDAGR